MNLTQTAMKHLYTFLTALVAVMLVGCAGTPSTAEATYTNPILGGDYPLCARGMTTT